jgi:hypothetical protein
MRVAAARIVTMEADPRVIELHEGDAQAVNQAYGTTGLITGQEMPLAPAWNWIDVIVAFPTFMDAVRFWMSYPMMMSASPPVRSCKPFPCGPPILMVTSSPAFSDSPIASPDKPPCCAWANQRVRSVILVAALAGRDTTPEEARAAPQPKSSDAKSVS